MAPKASGSRSPFDTYLFRSLEASNRYTSLYQNLSVCLGRPVRFVDFSNYHLQEYLAFQGWDHLFHDVEDVYPRLVRFLFANLKVSEDRRSMTTYIKGVKIPITPDLLGRMLDIPIEGFDIYYSDLSSFEYPEGQDKFKASALIRSSRSPSLVNDLSVKNLKPEAYLLAKLLFDSFLPKGGDSDYVRGPTTLMIYLLMTKQKINLPHLLMDCISDVRSQRRNLPFGSLYTTIFRHFDVDLDSENSIPPQPFFGKRVITNMLKTLASAASSSSAPRRVEEVEESDEEESEEEEENVTIRLDRLEEEVNTGFIEVNQRFDEVNEKLDSIIDHFHINPRRRRHG